MSTYMEDLKAKYPNRPYAGRPSWELANIRKALSMCPWLNGPEEVDRLADVKAEIVARRKEGRG